MISVSNDFKNAMKQPIKELSAYIRIDENNQITSADDLISFKISAEAGLCKTAMRKAEIKLIGEHELLDKWVNIGFGVKINGTYEYLDYGSFLITKTSMSKDTEIMTVEGYDKMILSMKEYSLLDITYPVDLYTYTKTLCEVCGLELGNESFTTHNDWPIVKELWENIDGITYRDIFVQIAQTTASTCMISNDKVFFKPIYDTEETLTYSNLKKLTFEPLYGEINSVILSRTPQEDNIYLRDEESIEENGLTEFKIENNEIVDKNREDAITPIFNGLKGISYYPFEINTEGLGWYEIGDRFTVTNSLDEEHSCVLFNLNITVDGGIKETLKAVAETKTQTQYQYASSIQKRLKNAEIVVNKQENYINSLVSDMYGENGIVNEQYTEISQNINEINTSIQTAGGVNLLLNSVMFAHDENGIQNWETSGNGTIDFSDSSASVLAGGVSGHVFILNDKKATQRVRVKLDSDEILEEEKTYYTFSTKISKEINGTCYVKIFNSNEEHTISIGQGENPYFADYEIKALLPKDNYYDIEFYGSAGSNATFTDNMFTIGTYKKQWTQANGEIINTQVNLGINGVSVKSATSEGTETNITPFEFAGYTMINGVRKKVFTLNGDTTEVEKIKSTKEINMPPLKIVPMTSGTRKGWAFVPTGGDS